MSDAHRWLRLAAVTALIVVESIPSRMAHAQDGPELALPATRVVSSASTPSPLPETSDGWVPSRGDSRFLPAPSIPPVEPVETAADTALPQRVPLESLASGLVKPKPASRGPAVKTHAVKLARWEQQLREASHSSYYRSLMGLSDHLENLALAEQASLAGLASQETQEGWREVQQGDVTRALEPRLRELRKVVNHLEVYQQPAAVGYDADLWLARYTLYDAQRFAALLTGKTSVIAALDVKSEQAAISHYRQRVFDAHFLGTATFPQLAEAAVLLNISPRLDWIPRQNVPGLVTRLDFQLAGLEHKPAWADRPRVVSDWMAADASAKSLWNGLVENSKSGTASLADLTHAWTYRWQLQRVAKRFDLQPSASASQELDDQLLVLNRRASAEHDVRGRIFADQLKVRVLTALREQEREAAVPASFEESSNYSR